MSEMEATATAPPPEPDTETPVRIRPITVDDYHRMLEAGILHEREPVELLNGQLIAMPPEGPLHSDVFAKLNTELVLRFAGRAVVRPGNPVTLRPLSEPQPDFTLARRRGNAYRKAHPGPDDVFLVVEVSHSSLRYDRREKLAAYAQAGIAEVWIVDLVHRHIEVYAGATGTRYAETRVVKHGDEIAPRAFPDDAIAVAAFLP
jgi:Uma2 family endonuclease